MRSFQLLGLLGVLMWVILLPIQAQVPGSNDDATPRSLAKLLQGVESKEQIPIIHSRSYCSTLPQAEQSSCMAANHVGIGMYKTLDAEHKKLGTMPLAEFTRVVEDLASLRDMLWQRGGYGNVVLAFDINRIIYWRIMERISTIPEEKLNTLVNLKGHYRYLEGDWKTIIKSIEAERNTRIKVDKKDEVDVQRLFIDSLQQLTGGRAVEFFTPHMFYTEKALDQGLHELFLVRLLYATSYVKTLGYYLQLRQKAGKFPEAVGASYVVRRVGDEVVLSTPSAQKFKVWVPRYIPKALSDKEPGWAVRFKWETFYEDFVRTKELDRNLPIEITYF